MDKNKNRVEILRKLVSDAGGPAEFARKYSRADADKPIDPTYVSQMLNGHRAFGERAASNMERRAGLPTDYFSSESTRVDASPAPLLPSTGAVIKPATERDTWLAELNALAAQLDLGRIGMLVQRAQDLVADMPAKQTHKSTQ